MRNCMQTERKKKGEFEGYDAFLPSRAKAGIGRFGGARFGAGVEMREGIRISATRWAEDDSTFGLGVASGLPVTQPERRWGVEDVR